MISFESRGSFQKTDEYLQKLSRGKIFQALEKYGQEGVNALASATPVDSGRAAASWGYVVTYSRGSASISWTNSDTESGFPVVISLQYGYGTGTGGFVAGRDFINPAIKPVFDRIATEVWKEVTRA